MKRKWLVRCTLGLFLFCCMSMIVRKDTRVFFAQENDCVDEKKKDSDKKDEDGIENGEKTKMFCTGQSEESEKKSETNAETKTESGQISDEKESRTGKNASVNTTTEQQGTEQGERTDDSSESGDVMMREELMSGNVSDHNMNNAAADNTEKDGAGNTGRDVAVDSRTEKDAIVDSSLDKDVVTKKETVSSPGKDLVTDKETASSPDKDAVIDKDTGKDIAPDSNTENDTAMDNNTDKNAAEDESDISNSDDSAEKRNADFSVTLKADAEEIKAGELLTYEIILNNTGNLDLNEIHLRNVLSIDRMKLISKGNERIRMDEETGEMILDVLKAGETVRISLPLPIPEDLSVPLEYSLTVTAEDPENDKIILRRDAELCTTIVPLTIDYEVEKTADHSVAYPGNEILYTIKIRNTGERTLHSILSTERFVNDGIQAVFLPQEGILLNKDRSQAYIAKLEPGEEAAIKASVTLPEALIGQELINQVYVTTKETGTITQTSEAAVQVEKPKPTNTSEPSPTERPADSDTQQIITDTSSENFISSAVQTGDESRPGQWVRISAASFLLVLLLTAAKNARR